MKVDKNETVTTTTEKIRAIFAIRMVSAINELVSDLNDPISLYAVYKTIQ
jgi:hypothetical protein